VGNIWEGQDVTFTVDAHPTRRFRGKVFQVRNAPTTVQNVVTYDAVVRIDNKELLLKPGMTANVEFLVSRKENVIRVPNVALRFKLPAETQAAQEVLRQAARTTRAGGGGRRRSASRSQSRDGREGRWVRVYILKDRLPHSVELRLGITDGSYTEVLEGEVEEGSQVIIAVAESAKAGGQPGITNPFQPTRVRGGRG
jgi:HlyD family secretion protein